MIDRGSLLPTYNDYCGGMVQLIDAWTTAGIGGRLTYSDLVRGNDAEAWCPPSFCEIQEDHEAKLSNLEYTRERSSSVNIRDHPSWIGYHWVI